MKTIKMFATNNSTAKWAVCVDGIFGLFDTKEKAESVYALIGNSIDDSPFGSCQMLPPGHVCKYINGWQPEGGCDDVATKPQANIEHYIRKNLAKKFIPALPTAVEQYHTRKAFAELFS